MDNPEDLVRTLEGQVERLKVIFNEATSALTDDVSEVSQFCVSLECCLRHHQREKLSFWGDRRDYWNYLSEGVSRMKSLETIVKRIQTLAHLTTSQGRGRGLIRDCLDQHMLGDLVQTAVSNVKRTKEWYHPTSVVQSPVYSQRLISALYDLSEVDFDLPSEGIDLDETWPSFVLKSFQSSDVRRSLFRGLSPATSKEAVAASTVSPSHRVTLERGIEEEASEIYIKQEIPFSISLVSNLLDDIRCNLVGQSETIGGHTHLCPDLEVTKLDDITSCLTILRDYITAWSCDVTKNTHRLQEEVRQARVHLADMEMQLQETMKESEGVETSLLNQLQDTRDDLQMCSNQIQELVEDNQTLKSSLSLGRTKISELEVLNFSLEEMLMEAQEGDGEEEEEVDGGRVEQRRERSATLVETALKEKDEMVERLSEEVREKEKQLYQTRKELTTSQSALRHLSSLLPLLQLQVVTEAEDKAAAAFQLTSKQRECSRLEQSNRKCVNEMEEMRGRGMEVEEVIKEGQERVESLQNEVERLNQECGVARDETTGLRYQLSSANMELQQTKELFSKKDSSLSSLQSKSREMESQLKETIEKNRVLRTESEELRRQLGNVEREIGSQSNEMSLLNEQLTEKTYSRDKERAELLRAQTSLDIIQSQLETEKQGYAKEVARLTEENNDIRRAFRRLLEQKVTLWQHADELEQEQQQQQKGKWVNSKTITSCMECSVNFTIRIRKHHCRACGRVCCAKCCDQKAQLPFSNSPTLKPTLINTKSVAREPVRVCEKCYQRINLIRTPFVSKFINSSDVAEPQRTPPTSSTVAGPSGGSSWKQSSNSLNIERNLEMGGNSLQAKLRLQNDDSSISSSFDGRWLNGSPRPGDGSNQSLEGSDNHEGGRRRGWSSIDEYSVDPEAKKRESARSSSQQSGTIEGVQYHIAAVEGDSLEESYYLVDTNPQFPVGVDTPGNKFLDVNALASKLASLEVRQHDPPLTATATNSAGGGVSNPVATTTAGEHPTTTTMESLAGFTEVVLEGGAAHTVRVKVEKKGTAIAWEFMSEPKGLAFGLSFETADDSMNEQVLPLRRCVSHKAALSGEYVAQKVGTYIIRFDNCHSKYSGRKLQYRHWVRPPT